MSKQRKVTNLLAVAVLSVLSERPGHTYEIAKRLRAWNNEQHTDLKWGSLYSVVSSLDKHGMIAVVGIVREGRWPERTIYRITDAGRTELFDWVRELIAMPMREHSQFRVGLAALSVLRPDDAMDLLRQRLNRLESNSTAVRATFVQHAERVPRLLLVESEYDLAIQEAEAAWIRSLLAELRSGDYPELTERQAFHETGEMPAEIAELASETEPSSGLQTSDLDTH